MTRRFGRYDLVRPTSLRTGVAHIQQRSVPETIHRPEYANTGIPDDTPVDEIQCKTPQDIKHMREACQLAAKALDYAQSLLKIGLTTDELDKAVHQWICDHGAYPSPLNYRGFPKSICTSISNVIAHGIPDDRPLKNGDIVNIDITVYFNGFHGDTSATFLIGEVDELGRLLVEATHKALDAAIQTCGPNQPFYLIGNAICDVADQYGFSVSNELSGHGIGRKFHMKPLIYHHRNQEPGIMLPGMTFTIEPVLCQKSSKGRYWPDGWTIVTADGGRSAQFEHTILITKDGVDILTQLPK